MKYVMKDGTVEYLSNYWSKLQIRAYLSLQIPQKHIGLFTTFLLQKLNIETASNPSIWICFENDFPLNGTFITFVHLVQSQEKANN